jgi:hypothetical protein
VLPQGALRGQRLGLEHIKAGAEKLASIQSRKNVSLDVQLPSCDID